MERNVAPESHALSQFYSIDSTRVSHREYWWGTRSPVVLIAWLLKWLRVRIPSSSDDPNVESTTAFVVEALPGPVAQHFERPAAELSALGFLDPIHHVFQDAGTGTTIYWSTFRHSSGQHFARIHQRIWHQGRPPDRGTFVLFFTALTDGTFVGASSGKPDFATPPTVPMLRQQGAGISALWPAYLEFLATQRQAAVVPIQSSRALVEATERHHVLLRDFNLARGVFKVRSGAEQEGAEAVARPWQAATAAGWQHPDVLAEVERLQFQRPGWGNALVILAVSVIAFLAAGGAQRNWTFTLGLIPILFFHESGHWLAMKCFGYRNLRMFFIPMFGAAVTGRKWNVAGWKKAIVSLAGPVPGIFVGVAFTLVGLLTGREWLNQAAFLLLILNGFNLLPVLPLDGGHVLHAILFCRNRGLDLAFRIVAIVALLALSVSGLGRFLAYIALVMAMGLPTVFKIGKVTAALRRTPLPPPLEGEDRIPPATADVIVTALKAELSPRTSTKTLALHTVNVFETLNARPPGALGTIGFLAAHGASLVMVLLCGFLLILNKHGGGLGNFARAAVRQPRYAVACDAITRWAGAQAATVSARNVLVSTLPNPAAARRQFASFTNRLPDVASLTRVGESLLLTLPAADDVARERWFAELQPSTNAFVALTNNAVYASLMCIAPDGATATNLMEELSDYLLVAHFGEIGAPWSPRSSAQPYASWRRARHTWSIIGTNTAAVWNAAAIRVFYTQIAAARKRGAVTEADRLIAEQAEVRRTRQAAAYERLRRRGADRELVDLHENLNALSFTNRAERVRLERQIAARLGSDVDTNGPPSRSGRRYGVSSGVANQQGLIVELRWVGFKDAATGLPALIEWLCQNRCRSIKYEIHRAALLADDSTDLLE